MIKKIIAIITIAVMVVASVNIPVMADEETSESSSSSSTVEANILTDCAKRESGQEKINCILNLVVEIMSVGVGILGVIGISVVGIQYLTAGGSEEKTRKAKRRMLEIVLGIAVYVIIYAILKWLLPAWQS